MKKYTEPTLEISTLTVSVDIAAVIGSENEWDDRDNTGEGE